MSDQRPIDTVRLDGDNPVSVVMTAATIALSLAARRGDISEAAGQTVLEDTQSIVQALYDQKWVEVTDGKLVITDKAPEGASGMELSFGG